MGKRVAVLVRDKNRQYEGLRTSLGLLLDDHQVTMVVLDHEIEMSEAYEDNLRNMEEMGGNLLSTVSENVQRHGFQPVTLAQLADRLKSYELIIPF